MGQLRMVGSKPMIETALSKAGVEVEAQGGHTTLEYGPEAAVSAEQAEEVFARLQGMGFKAYETKGSTGTPVETFDPEAREVVLMPPMAGGRL